MPKMNMVLKGLLVLGCFMASWWVTSPTLAGKHNRETPVVKAVQQVGPAVVNVSTETVDHQGGHPFSGFGNDPFFDHFFKDFFESWPQREYRRTSLGSGVIIDGGKGHVLTNAHVISRATTITVTLQDEREFAATVVGMDPDADLAVLRISADAPLPSVSMGASDDLMIGETVIAIGNPFGFSHTVTTGVISAVNRSIRAEEQVFRNFIQIDASINPGNSGGPLLNINGELIGINTAIYAKAQGIGFAIPIDTAKRIVSDLITFGEVVQAWTGVLVQELDPNLAAYLKVPRANGVVVRKVMVDSPAEIAGIRDGDILLSLNRIPVGGVENYLGVLANIGVGELLTVSVWRDGKALTLSIKTTVFPEALAGSLAEELLGIVVADIDKDLRSRYRIVADDGVVITDIRPHTEMDRIGILPGDVIRRIEELDIAAIVDYKKAIVKLRRKKSIEMLVQRGRRGYAVTIKLQ